MQCLKNNCKYILIGLSVLVAGLLGLAHGVQIRVRQAAEIACAVQYDYMMSDLSTNDEIINFLASKQDAFCACWVKVAVQNWESYAIMSKKNIAVELTKNAPSETENCIDVFLDGPETSGE